MAFYNSNSNNGVGGGSNPSVGVGPRTNPHSNQEANNILREFQGTNETGGGVVLRDFQDVGMQVGQEGGGTVSKRYSDNPESTTASNRSSTHTNSIQSTSGSSNANKYDLESIEEDVMGTSARNLGIRGGQLIVMTDESSEKEHDQLPPINDVLMNFYQKRGSRHEDQWAQFKSYCSKFNLSSHRRNVRVWSYAVIVFSIVVMFASILGLSVHLSRASDSISGDVTSANNDAGSYHTTMYSRSGQMISLVSGTISDDDDIIRVDSPQRQAIQFLAQDDLYQIGIPTSLVEEENENSAANVDSFLQRYAVAVLSFALGGRDALEHSTGFFSNAHECTWHRRFQRPVDGSTLRMGITCNNDDQIDKIVLQTMQLTGSLPREIGLLTNLKTLRLDDNNITSLLPNHMKHCTELEELSMSMNHLHGHIDEWLPLQLTNLKKLELSYNELRGALPQNFTELTNLEVLALDHNSLHGDVSAFTRTFTSLREIYLSHNNFGGHLHPQNSFRRLTNLEIMDMSDNKLMGSFPMNVFSLPSLRVVDLSNNAISGPMANDDKTPIPEGCPVHYLDVSENFIFGSIPTTIGNMAKLRHFDVTTNRFDGGLPHSMGSLTNLEYLYLQDNAAFTPSPIPHWLRFLTNLKELHLMNTARTGAIPNAFEYLGSNLRVLNLGLNQLNSTIPASLGNATSLQYLLLNRNTLTGTVPTELGTLQKLGLFTVDHNHLVGTISKEVCSIPQLTSMTADCDDSGPDGNCPDCLHSEPQIQCPCCTTCCTFDQAGCNTGQYLMQEYKSEWSDPYSRPGHVFAPMEERKDSTQLRFEPLE